MSAILKYFKELKLQGLFQTDNNVGKIFPIIIKNNTPTFNCGGIPTYNDCRGENVALQLMRQKNFVCWAIDPWNGKINIKFQYEE